MKKPVRRLKSTSKGGQSLAKRASESKGKRKKELTKLSKVDKANFKKAPPAVKKKIKAEYVAGKKKKTRAKNRGRYI